MKYFLLISTVLFAMSCTEPAITRAVREGGILAKTHCSTCHQFPEPALLDKKTWAYHVLPKMGSFLGFRHFEGTSYIEDDYATRNINLQEWNKIVTYYIRQSPDSVRQHLPTATIDTSLKQFRVKYSSFNIKPPLTSYAGVFPEDDQIIFADGLTRQYYRLKNMQLVDSFELSTGISQFMKSEGHVFGLSMGVMHPADVKEGKLVEFTSSGSKIILDSLQRPVHAVFADLNKDSLSDIVVCEFGNNTGQLTWFKQVPEKKYVRHILKPLSGAIKTVIRDFNGDGLPDIMALMAQADEGMFIFYNQGSGKFREQRLLQFSPAFGSNYFELADLTGDGYDDIIATNGDNGDYPPILKPYHGIRVYVNDGKNNFSEELFLPVNGVCKAIARDFDGDGDPDLASIAYFPDYEHRPYESFIYWENTGRLHFTPHSFPAALSGRWLVMDAGDIDHDGDPDIVIGSAKMAMGRIPEAVMKKWNENSPSVILLENRSANGK